MNFWVRMFGEGFSEGRWNGKAIPIMNELVQMVSGVHIDLCDEVLVICWRGKILPHPTECPQIFRKTESARRQMVAHRPKRCLF